MNQLTAGRQKAVPSASSRWIALSILFLTLAMSMIDLSVANLTLPSIRTGLSASDATLSWVVAGYTLAYALALVPGGRLGDRYGRKNMFLIGTTMHLCTGIAGAMASDDVHLVIFRLLHGVSGGLMIPPIAAFIQVMFEGRDRARAFGFYGSVVAIGAIIGPVIGGWILEAVGPQNGWRYALSYGLTLGVPAVVLGLFFLPDTEKVIEGRFDYFGSLLMSLAVVGLFVPLIQMTKGVMPSWAPASAIAALVMLVAFLFWERHLERTKAFPLLPLSLFREKTFTFGLLLAVLSVASFTGSIYIAFAVIWQSGRGEGALAAAFMMLPFSIASAVGPLASDWAVRAFKQWASPLSLILLFGGYLVTYLMVRENSHVAATALALPMTIAGLGCGLFFSLNMTSALSTVPSGIAGSAVGALVTVQRIGSAFGAAIVILLISQPGPGGPDDFGAPTMLVTGTHSVLFCTAMAGAALIVSFIEVLMTRTKPEPRASVGFLPRSDRG